MGTETKGQGEDTPRIANHLILRVKDERGEKLERLRGQDKWEVKGVNECPRAMVAHRGHHQDPRGHRVIYSGDGDQVGNEREESMGLNHGEKKK